MSKEKTVQDVIAKEPKHMPFGERAAAFEKDLQPLVDKWGVAPWASLTSTPEAIAAIPVLRDMLEEKA